MRPLVSIATLLGLLALAPTIVAQAYVDPSTGESVASGVIRAFDKPEHNWLPGHRGVDLRLNVGAPVLAAGAGNVAFAGIVAGTPTVSIDHLDGVRTTYQPLHARVSQGDWVEEADIIGTLAHPTGQWPGLQWGARSGPDRDEYLNPLSLLDSPTIRLKPVGALGHRPL